MLAASLTLGILSATNPGRPILPDFLWGLVESPNFMRLSSKKAAHATLGGAAYRNPGI